MTRLQHVLATPAGTFALFFAAVLAMLALSRAGLLAWQFDRLAAVEHLHRIFTLGVRLDLALLSYLAVLPLLLHMALPPSALRTRLGAALLAALGTLLI
ncbi:MAG: hypothetical protein ACRETF_02835, partial [Nevskiaceae bacterium]